MKTKYNVNRACNMAIVFVSAIMFSSSIMAQPQKLQDAGNVTDVQEAFDRLDAYMSLAEQSFRYTPPTEENDDLRSVWERLDLAADNIEREIRYKVPENEADNTVEFANNEPAQQNKNSEELSYNAVVTNTIK
jgi:hypothetical protein